MSRYAHLEAVLHELKRRQDPVDQALATLVGMEAAVSVLHKHNLLQEWGVEVERLKLALKEPITLAFTDTQHASKEG